MKEFLGLVVCGCLLFVLVKTDVGPKAVAAVEAWLDAKAIEARRAETGTGSVHESAGRQASPS